MLEYTQDTGCRSDTSEYADVQGKLRDVSIGLHHWYPIHTRYMLTLTGSDVNMADASTGRKALTP